MGQTVKFGRVPFQIGVPQPHQQKEGWQGKLNEQRSLELYNKIPKFSKHCSKPEELENSQQTAQFLSRAQSLSSSDIFQLLSVNSISACFGNGTLEPGKDDRGGDHEGNNILNLNEEIKQWVDEIRALLSSGKGNNTRWHKYKTRQTTCMTMGPMAEWLKAKLVNIVQRGRGRKREYIRLQTTKMHAALSVARLATVVAGVIGNCHFESTNTNSIIMTGMEKDDDKKMHAAIASAAALVAASCAEAAKFTGASREQVSSVINMGLETRALGDLLTLTTSAATCLRGVNALKMRNLAVSNYAFEDIMNSQKGDRLTVRTPDGRLHIRMVSAHCKYDKIILKLGKGRSFTTTEKYIVFDEQGESKDLSYATDEYSYHWINLSTSGGTIQLLFKEHEQYSAWKSFINYLIINKSSKLSYRTKTHD